jgi:hypothetical protein
MMLINGIGAFSLFSWLLLKDVSNYFILVHKTILFEVKFPKTVPNIVIYLIEKLEIVFEGFENVIQEFSQNIVFQLWNNIWYYIFLIQMLF